MDRFVHEGGKHEAGIGDPGGPGFSPEQYAAAMAALKQQGIGVDPGISGAAISDMEPWDINMARLIDGVKTVTDTIGNVLPVPSDLTPAVDPVEPVNEWTKADPTGADPTIGLWRSVKQYAALVPPVAVKGDRYLPTDRGMTMS